tara:strand:+ start:19 stop:303 length:285 start_codon:yes stop_codon:yes gene_type:complete
MKITKTVLKRLIREVYSDLQSKLGAHTLGPEESEWAAREEEGDEMITDDIEEAYEALMADLDQVEDPKMQADIIALFQSALKLGPEDIEPYKQF